MLVHIIQTVNNCSDLEEVYRVALDSVIGLENVDIAMIYLVDEEKDEAVLEDHRNLSEDYLRRAGSIRSPKGVTWKVINTGKIINLEDIQKDPDIGLAGRDLGHHGALGIPVFMEERTIGVIWFVSYKEHRFNELEVNLLSSIGHQIALAIARAKMFEEVKRWKDTLEESEQRYHVLAEHTYDLVCEVSVDGRFLYLSSKHTDMLGYELKELLGRSIFEYVHPDDHAAVMTEFARAVKTFSSGHAVYRYRHKNGEWRWLESTGSIFSTSKGEVRGVLASRDITEQKLIAEDMLKADKPQPKDIAKLQRNRISVVVATFSYFLRDGVYKMLESDKEIEIIAHATTHPELLHHVVEKKPDVLFIDADLPKLDVEEILELIQKKGIKSKVLLMLHRIDDEEIINAISSGCSGILTHLSNRQQLIRAIKAVNKGEIWAGRIIVSKALKQLLALRKGRIRIITSLLTKREEEIVELVLKDHKNGQIATELSIKGSTLKTHFANIFKKLGIKTRSQLVSQFSDKVIPRK
jgi:PAS domain S-box-containing protein